jgi:hypothetical protein
MLLLMRLLLMRLLSMRRLLSIIIGLNAQLAFHRDFFNFYRTIYRVN